MSFLFSQEKVMLHLLYIFAFTVLAFMAVSNLVRNLMILGADTQRSYGSPKHFSANPSARHYSQQGRVFSVPHPELLDEAGNIVNEPFLVMRSINVEDAREQLDALYNASSSPSDGAHDGM
jgi:hypothetical protein